MQKLVIQRREFFLLGMLLVLTIFIFGHNLGFTALQSYDEAWYGVISRNLLSAPNPFLLEFNGKTFTDHPPFGFWLMALPAAFYGSNEITVRIISVITGAFSLILMYLIGRQLASRFVGVASAAMLFSMMWFVFRVRSGNLDVPFMCFELLTIFIALQKGKLQIYFLAISFSILLLTKTLIGIGLTPVLVFLLWQNRSNISFKSFALSLLIGFLLVSPWYIINQLHDSNFLYHHFIEIGIRDNDNIFSLTAIAQNFQYLAIGVGKWYKVLWLSLPTTVLLWWKKPKTRQSLIMLSLWALGFSPFLISSETEIWHLLPLYPVLSLATAFSLFSIIRYLPAKILTFTQWILLGFFISVAAFQFNQFSNLLYFDTPQFSAEKDIAIKAKSYSNLQLVETFYPATVYYAEQDVRPLHWQPNAYQIMKNKLESGDNDTFIINEQLKLNLEQDQIDFQVLEANESYFLIKN